MSNYFALVASFNVAFIVDVFVNGSWLLVAFVLLELEAFSEVNTMDISIFDEQMWLGN